eukprot:TRINITY_DN782319_c0_g1_i1.p1 TRINITY_DN782319_c0_g1~~TRINITY_DN782319_c0_g1_i1.p1  ORF type:complete len:118 (-),score=19.95 TRINITY_DN782319_c0_g1_i1:121-474(-)
MNTLPDVDQAMKELLGHPRVDGFIVFNEVGVPIRWSSSGFSSVTGVSPLPIEVTHYAALISDLVIKASATIKHLMKDDASCDPTLRSIRLHTKINEIVVAPCENCTLVVLQKAAETA